MIVENALPTILLDRSSARISFGGEFNLGKMKFIYRTITNMMQLSAWLRQLILI